MPPLHRLASVLANWSQLWAFTLAQSLLGWDQLAQVPRDEGGEYQGLLGLYLGRIEELRSLRLDQAEWGLVEAFVIGGGHGRYLKTNLADCRCFLRTL